MARISHGDPFDESVKPDLRNDLTGTHHHSDGQTVPEPGSENPGGGKSIFDPHLEFEMP